LGFVPLVACTSVSPAAAWCVPVSSTACTRRSKVEVQNNYKANDKYFDAFPFVIIDMEGV
jgi:hypothetical protein